MNQHDYSLRYNGLAVAVEKRQANGWQAFTSYTFSRACGLQASSGATAAGAQVSTVSPPPPLTFGRDPNDLTNARGRLPNDRPHIFRVMGSVDVPRTGFVIAGNLQHFSGKPWAATAACIPLPQGDVRVLLEPRGSRRLSSQTLLDLRVSRAFAVGGSARVELLVDVLNLLNDTAEEALASDNFYSPSLSFGQPTVFVDPRRAMISVRLNLGRSRSLSRFRDPDSFAGSSFRLPFPLPSQEDSVMTHRLHIGLLFLFLAASVGCEGTRRPGPIEPAQNPPPPPPPLPAATPFPSRT